MVADHRRSAPQHEPASRVVDLGDRRVGAGPRIGGPVAGPEPVVLGREGEPLEHAPLVQAHVAHEGQVADRVRGLDQVVRARPVSEVEPPPPLGLGLAPVVVKEGGLLRRPLGRVLGHPGPERLHPGQRLAIAGFLGLGRRPVAERGPREVPAVGDGLAPASLQPVAQPEGRHAIVAVVGGKVVEMALLAVMQPVLVLHDAEAGPRHAALAVEAEEVLDLLERVRLDRGPDALADDPVEVHEDAAAEQPVDLVLPRRVALHQAFDGAGLVAAVVVDVHRGVPVEAVDDVVDERLEGGPLLPGGVRPEGPVAG